MSGVLILGSGGHGKVVADILQCQGVVVRGFLDDDPATWGGTTLGLPVLGPLDAYADYTPAGLVLGVGSNTARRQIVVRLGKAAGSLWCNAVHPRAILAASVDLGQGVVVAGGAVINPDTLVGDHAIINTGATVDHDSTVGPYAHLAPGTHLAGGVQVGEGVLVGVGAVVTPYRVLGPWSTIGAGAVVVHDIPARVVAKGVPAHW